MQFTFVFYTYLFNNILCGDIAILKLYSLRPSCGSQLISRFVQNSIIILKCG